MRLFAGRPHLPLLMLCFNCMVAENGKFDPYNHDGTKEPRPLVEAMGKIPKIYLESSWDDPTANSPRADLPCPVASAIEPCVCTADPDVDRLYMDCTLVESEEQLEAVFQQDFPVKQFNLFSMSNNSAVRMLLDFSNGITFEKLMLSPGPFALETISDYLLLDLKDTVKDILIQDSNLIAEMFPFLVLPAMNQLSTLRIFGSDMDWIPPIRAPNLTYFAVTDSPVERLVNGTIPIGTGEMSVSLFNNLISTVEPGSIFFADEESAASSELLFITLDQNRLQSLQAGSFPLRNGESTLLITSNQIASIETGTFVLPNASGDGSYGKLFINLALNQLKSLHAGTFPLRNGAVTLYLNSNSISSIEPGTFVLPEATDAMILVLDLSYNELTTIDEAVFGDLMPFISYLGLYQNPLTCGCDVLWLIQDTAFMDVVDVYTVCADGTLLHDLNPEDFVDMCLV